METIPISDLLPLEGAVVGDKLQEYRSTIAAGGVLVPPKVVEVDGGIFLVTDGNHRVYASKLQGMTEMSVRVVDSGGQRSFHSNEARHAARRGRLGFENMSEMNSDEARKIFTDNESKENDAVDFNLPQDAHATSGRG